MKDYLTLIRIKHYIKNVLIFAALVFSGQLFVWDKTRDCALGFLAFSLMSSVIYIFNDIRDKDKDKIHPTKCKRPIASGRVSVKAASLVAIVCLAGFVLYFFFVFNIMALLLVLAYAIINVLYSYGLKNKPLIDVSILVAGFLIRVVYGAVLTGIEVSNWLYLTVIAISFFMAFGKRRNELKQMGSNDTREVLKGYSLEFLDKSMYMCLAMANTFYALWAIGSETPGQDKKTIFTVPIVLLITLKYSLIIENGTSDGDPIEVLLHDKFLIVLCLLYALIMFAILYMDQTGVLFF